MAKKVIVGLSGGVDSSIAAYLLIEQGYHIEGLFMKNWEEDDTDAYCASKEDFEYAKAIAKQLDIKLHAINFSSEYYNEVFDYFIKEYQQTRTPNPDVLCNEKIKFKAFLNYAKLLGGDYIATGHYANIQYKNKHYYLHQGIDEKKDQSYFLHRLNQQQLKHSLFPLGNLTKKEVKQIAREKQLKSANKKESMGICFIGKKKMQQFLSKYIQKKPGDIVDTNGNFIKKHIGLSFYTIGQRKGLAIGGGFNKNNNAWYVVDKNITKNQLVVAQENDPTLYHQHIIASNVHWINDTPNKTNCQAKIRYQQPHQNCTIEQKNNTLYIQFQHSQKAVAPGQAIVFYHQSQCLGGAIIDKRF